MGTFGVLQQIAHSDERAFDLFFTELDAAIGQRLDSVKVLQQDAAGVFAPASRFLEAFLDRPARYLTPVTVGCLRAALDGYSLAAIEEGHLECADLTGFEHWVRASFALKGMFRWEDAVLAHCFGDESRAFQWAIKELVAYRSGSKLHSHDKPPSSF